MKKTITLYNYEVNNIVEALRNPQSIMYTNDPEKKLPISVLWKMDENFEKLQNIAIRIQKKREEIEMDYADDEHSYIDDSEQGMGNRKVKEEYFEEFNKRLSELMSIQNAVDIDCIDIETLKDYSLVPRDYRTIRFMLDKDEKEEPESEKNEIVE